MRHWLGAGITCLILLGGGSWCSRSGAEPIQAPYQVDCTHYVDNQAGTDGDGSLNAPWNNIAEHVNDLGAGHVMCVRGDLSPPGRVYTEPGIYIGVGCADGAAEAPITVRTYPREYVVLRSTAERDVVAFQGVSYWRLEGFALDKESRGGYGISFAEADFNVVYDCDVYDGSHEGIHLTSGMGNVIEHTSIHDFDAGPYQDAHGILVQGATDTIISNNEIYNCTGSGIQLWDTGDNSGTIIQDNHIYTTWGPCSEGGITVKRGNPIISSNVMHGYRYCDGSCGGTGGGVGGAVIVYMQAHDVLFEANEIYDCASGISVDADNVQIVNNVIHDLVVDSGAWANMGLFVYHSANVDILNNTFANVPHNVLWIGGNVHDLDVRNNLFYDTNCVQNEYSQSQVTADYNGWFSATERLQGPHDIVGYDPRFVASGDYHLRGSSPVVNTGDNLNAPTHDFDGNPRPYGPAVDLGAFEVQEPLPVTSLRAAEAVTTTDSVTITLTWITPGRTGQPGTAHHYELRHDYRVITEEGWDQAVVSGTDIPAGQAGEVQSTTANVPWGGTAHWHAYFALRAFDADGRVSEVSNPAFWPAEFTFLPVATRTRSHNGTLLYGDMGCR